MTNKLIVFDFDGTLLNSENLNVEVLNRAAQSCGWNIHISREKVIAHTGEPGTEFYKNILPSKYSFQWERFRKQVQNQYIPVMAEYGELFPSVIGTLKALKEQGCQLVLYSNCSRPYFEAAFKKFPELLNLLDYNECVTDHNLSKPELLKKIREKFGNPETTVVGDKDHDIDAARENQAASVACLYGYGSREELEDADFYIEQFSDLMDIFTPKTEIFEEILEEISTKKEKKQPFVIGINGIDGSGKTTFALQLDKYFKLQGFKTQRIHIDDFHNQKSIRYDGPDQAENYFLKSFNLKEIQEKLLDPIQRKKSFVTKFQHLNLETDEYDQVNEYHFEPETIVLFEGVFLFRDELRPYLVPKQLLIGE